MVVGQQGSGHPLRGTALAAAAGAAGLAGEAALLSGL